MNVFFIQIQEVIIIPFFFEECFFVIAAVIDMIGMAKMEFVMICHFSPRLFLNSALKTITHPQFYNPLTIRCVI